MSIKQYDVRFMQLSRYACSRIGTWRSRKDETIYKGLRLEIISKLILFQLQIYIHAMEKALEVERDMMED